MAKVPIFQREFKPKFKERVPGDLQDNEIVDIMFLDYDIPRFYKIEHGKKMEAAIKEAEATGTEFKPTELTFQNSGIEWRVAVIRRAGVDHIYQEPNELVFELGADFVTPPKYVAMSSVTVWSPPVHYTRQLNDGRKIGDWIREGGGDDFINENPRIIELFPSVNNEKDHTAEQKRLADWNMVTSWWTGLSEKEAIEALNNYVARKMLVYKKPETQGENVEYMPIQKGTIVRACITRGKNTNSKYFNVKAFEFPKKNDAGKWERKYYSNGGIYNEHGPVIGQHIIDAFAKIKAEYEEKQKQKLEAEAQQDNHDDETPWEEQNKAGF